jgi:metallophosphoesterase (TIGR03767 family)
MGSPPFLTLDRTFVAGEVVASGGRGSYRRLAAGPGEPRLRIRGAEAPSGVAGTAETSGRRRSLAHLAQVSDLQLADVKSPGRFEFFEVLRGLPRTGSFVPAQRPQEALLPRAFDSVLRTLELCRSRETGAPLDLVVSTGDNLDNAQWNELQWYLGLMAGGVVDVGGAQTYQGVQAAGWPGDLAWKPDGGADRWRTDHGYPTIPGLIETALAPFQAGGLSVPWLSCFGNHDGLPLGEVIPTEGYRSHVLSSRKPFELPAGFDPLAHETDLFVHPERFLSGPSLEVAPDAARRVVGRREFVEAHLRAPGRPEGHGYSSWNLEAGVTYFSYDVSPLVRVIVLDTANLDGFHAGSIGARQRTWLEERLLDCHSSCLAADGRPMSGGGDDRLVVLASHHGLQTMTNLRQSEIGLEDDHPRVGGDELMALLRRFPNVVLWLNGHTHWNQIRLHRSYHRDRGDQVSLVEVTTCSIADWPSQGRLVELVVDEASGALSVLTTMVDHESPLVPGSVIDEPGALASLHRELAGNMPGAGFGSFLEGSPTDRNCEIVLEAPFPLG